MQLVKQSDQLGISGIMRLLVVPASGVIMLHANFDDWKLL